MRKGLIAAIGIMLVAVPLVVPVASANHFELRQEEDYVGFSVGTPTVPFLRGGSRDVGPLCNPLGININIGGACFELDGRESEIDITVNDIGHNALWKAESKLDRRANQNLNPIDPALADLVEETFSLRFVSGFVWFVDEGGSPFFGRTFCQSALHMKVPPGAAGVEVWLDGPFFGDPYAGTTADIENSIIEAQKAAFNDGTALFDPRGLLSPDSGCDFGLLGIESGLSVNPKVGPTQATLGTIFLVVQEDP